MEVIIRKANPEENEDIAKITDIEWRTTYKNILPEEVIEKREKVAREKRKLRKETIKKEKNYFVALINNKIVGFSSIGPTTDNEYPNAGQIYACYILDEYHGLGIGRKLIIKSIEELISRGYTTMITGCLVGNLANEFHKSVGGEYIKTTDFDIFGFKAKENIYFHDNLNKSLELNKEKIKVR